MKNAEPGRYYNVGQKLLLSVGDAQVPVTFLSLGPRTGSANDPKTAVVRDEQGKLLTVLLADLQLPKSN